MTDDVPIMDVGDSGRHGVCSRSCPAASTVSFPRARPQGDYLRGLGIAAWGMGLTTSTRPRPTRSTVDTDMRWNEYLAAVAKQQTREYVARKMADATERKEFYKQNRERILNSPEARDVSNGEALNRVLEELLELQRRRIGLPLRTDAGAHPRRHRSATFRSSSARRANNSRWIGYRSRGRATWTVALQDTKFEHVKKAYARALDKALEQAIDGKMQISAIDEVEAKADDLFRRLERGGRAEQRSTLYRSQGTTERAEIHRATPQDREDRAGDR